MAVKEIMPQKVDFNSIQNIEFVAASTVADGCKFIIPRDFAGSEYLTILAQNTGNAVSEVSVKAPTNGSYAAADSNLTLANIPANGIVAIRIESAKYANNDGSVVVLAKDTATKFAVIY